MRHNADNKFTPLVLRAVFALSLTLAAFAPASLAREDASFAAGPGVYENTEEETAAHRLRVEEFRLKKSALQAQMENDEMTARRLQARAKRLYDEAERLEARAERAEENAEDKEAERLEAAAERLEKQADDLDDAADDLWDSAEDARENRRSGQSGRSESTIDRRAWRNRGALGM